MGSTDVFPSGVCSYPLEMESAWKTRITPFESGKEQRKQVQAFPKRTVKIKTTNATNATLKDVYKLYQRMRGSYDYFWFYVEGDEPASYYDEYLGKGDGSTVTYDLCSKNTVEASINVYTIDSSGNRTGPLSKTFSSGTGQGGSDRITLAVAPATGTSVVADFDGYLRLKARFNEDKLTREVVEYMLYSIGLEIIEVR